MKQELSRTEHQFHGDWSLSCDHGLDYVDGELKREQQQKCTLHEKPPVQNYGLSAIGVVGSGGDHNPQYNTTAN